MRIIAGQLKGRKVLSLPKTSGVRPISGRIKQSLFDILRPKIRGADFLDLFAGTGAVGLEACSRGARHVVFVDSGPASVKAIERNLEHLGLNFPVIRCNVLSGLSYIRTRAPEPQGFDLIFMGPPYKDELKRPLRLVEPTLEKIGQASLLAPDGWVIAQHHVREKVENASGFQMFRQEKYGDTFLSFFKHPELKGMSA